MVKYIVPLFDGYAINYNALREDIHKVVRAMDKVIDVTTFPLPEQREEAINKRRMGIGLTGVANAIERIGYPYASSMYLEEAEALHKFLRDECYNASIALARERGPFPLFDKEKYPESNFIKTLPGYIKEDIARYGIRNSHLISYAPTGTISITADNISSSIEPVFSHSYTRGVTGEDGVIRQEEIKDYAYNFWGIKGRKATDLTVDQHLSTLALAQKYCDSAVSKTINVGSNVSWEEFKDIYFKAWELGCKGVTTYRPDGKRKGILMESEPQNAGACTLDPTTGERSCE